MYLHLDLRLCGHLEVSHISKKLLTSKKQSSELRDRIVGHRCAGKKGYHNKKTAALLVPQNTVTSIILNWKKLGTTRTLPWANCLTKYEESGKRVSLRDKKLMIILAQHQRWEKFSEGQPKLQVSTNLSLMAERADGSLSSVRLRAARELYYSLQRLDW